MKYEDGQKIYQIVFDGVSEITASDNQSIIVSMENGQMALVPWFEVYFKGKLKSKWNAALVSGVIFDE